MYNTFSKGSKTTDNWRTELLNEIKWSRKFLDGVIIENLDFRVLVDKYSPRVGDFWYMDPPYMVAGEKKDYYYHDFNTEMHDALKTICDIINQNGAHFMLSYDNKDEIKKLYKNYNINKIKCIYAGSLSKRKRTELVITNYDVSYCEQIPLFKMEEA